MSHSVYRYPLDLVDLQDLTLPAGARILHVARSDRPVPHARYDSIALWALVDTDAPPQTRRLRIVGTGHLLHDAGALHHLGSVQLEQGQLVFHIFEEIRAERTADSTNTVALEGKSSL